MTPVWLTDTVTQDLSRSIDYTLLWGLEGVVLRHLDRGARVPDVNETKLTNRLADSDLTVAAVDPGIFEGSAEERVVWLNDLERLEETAAFCRRIGCARILSGALPGGPLEAATEVFSRAAARVARHGVQLCVRNHGNGRWTARQILDMVAPVRDSRLLVCWDPVEAQLFGGEPPLEVVDEMPGRAGIVIVRDYRGESGSAHAARLGKGELAWQDVLFALARGGFEAPLCLEFEDVSRIEAFQDATALIHMIRAARKH
jgi:sugar phosphate isomerase/epimerase